MTRQAFDALVLRIEGRFAGRQPRLERAIGRWLVLGLVVLLAWLLIVTGVGLAVFALGVVAEPPLGPILIVVGALLALYGISQGLYLVRVEPDTLPGRPLEPGEATALGSMLEEIRRDLRCRPFDEVRVTIDLNAAVREVPRGGLPGRYRTILEVGLPLARFLGPDELKAVLAHESVHLSARHGRSVGRIYRLNRRWGNLFQKMQRPASNGLSKMARWATSKFVNWYWPRLHARSLVLSRFHEFQADREAARVAGPSAMANALWRIELLRPWLSDRFWAGLWAEAAEVPEPPVDVAARLSAAIQAPPSPEDAALWAGRGLARATLRDETHPALLDRVRPLGLGAEDLRQIGFPVAASPSAAEALLGEALPAVERDVSEDWHKQALGPWRDRHRRARSEARRNEVVRGSTAGPVPPASAEVHSLWESACEAANLRGPASAVPLLRQVLDRDPGHDGAAVVLGRHLALAGDPEGEAMLARVLDGRNEGWIPAACEALQEVYRASGRPDRVREIRERLDRHEADLEAARRERATIAPGDPLAPHDLSDDHLDRLRALLAAHPDVGTAWLVRKRVRHFPNRPLFVLCLQGADARWWSKGSEREQASVRKLMTRVELPGQVFVIARSGPFAALARRVAKSPGARVFDRAGDPRP